MTAMPNDDVDAEFDRLVADQAAEDLRGAQVGFTRILKAIAHADPVWDRRMVCGTCRHQIPAAVYGWSCSKLDLGVFDSDTFGCSCWAARP